MQLKETTMYMQSGPMASEHLTVAREENRRMAKRLETKRLLEQSGAENGMTDSAGEWDTKSTLSYVKSWVSDRKLSLSRLLSQSQPGVAG
jgi:hypothetical protein